MDIKSLIVMLQFMEHYASKSGAESGILIIADHVSAEPDGFRQQVIRDYKLKVSKELLTPPKDAFYDNDLKTNEPFYRSLPKYRRKNNRP